jgi:hypothetical protein
MALLWFSGRVIQPWRWMAVLTGLARLRPAFFFGGTRLEDVALKITSVGNYMLVLDLFGVHLGMAVLVSAILSDGQWRESGVLSLPPFPAGGCMVVFHISIAFCSGRSVGNMAGAVPPRR